MLHVRTRHRLIAGLSGAAPGPDAGVPQMERALQSTPALP